MERAWQHILFGDCIVHRSTTTILGGFSNSNLGLDFQSSKPQKWSIMNYRIWLGVGPYTLCKTTAQLRLIAHVESTCKE